MFFIRRLKNLGASVSTQKEAYVLFVRPTLEMCAPLWAGALTQKQTKFLVNSLERVQHNFCKIVYPLKSYETSRELLELQTLQERRIKLSKKCASKMSKNSKFTYLFPKVQNSKTRSKKQYREPKWKSIRYGFSSIPFFIRLLNGEIV